MPPELQELWQRCAHLQQVDYAGLREAEEPRAEPPSELEVPTTPTHSPLPTALERGDSSIQEVPSLQTAHLLRLGTQAFR